MQSNEFGKIVIESWKWLIHSHSFLNMDYFIVMPNHFHGILNICGGRRGRSRTAPTDPAPNTTVKPVGRLIAIFKTITTKQINILKGTPGGKLWQRNYYEHVVRNEDALRRIREYIQNNPLRWHLDRENFEKIDSDPFDAWLDSFKLKHRITRRG
ncbi:MAG: transposase [Deltaproteobacteria bacterium]|nr:transposase [Deltaproteobacteria bacterium]